MDDNLDPFLAARQRAASFQAALDPRRSKILGQFFTGLELARLLAALSITPECETLLDPMAGHGDLLDAALERSAMSGSKLTRVAAIEIDPDTASMCNSRLEPWREREIGLELTVFQGSAFDTKLIASLERSGYDVVITNPPYVRYQTQVQHNSQPSATGAEDIRTVLSKVVEQRTPPDERRIWHALVDGYSGLADLAVPCWLLAAMLVKPGGILALVAPATWRTRNYSDVLQYLVARCFKLETIVADQQPGWFSKALVRTHLVVARRRSTTDLVTPLRLRPPTEEEFAWIEISRRAVGGSSLVGSAFPGKDPEGTFAAWIKAKSLEDAQHVAVVQISQLKLDDEASRVLALGTGTGWMRAVEPDPQEIPLLQYAANRFEHRLVPLQLQHITGAGYDLNLIKLEDSSIAVGQGLRTGCNGFFYVDLIEYVGQEEARIRELLGGGILRVPKSVLRPVLRRQSDTSYLVEDQLPPGRVLDLNEYVLPEDYAEIEALLSWMDPNQASVPSVMTAALAEIVRRAARTRYGPSRSAKRIPELSAVKTNVRPAIWSSPPRLPRFWYMLPPFSRRHMPDAFVARINQSAPTVVANLNPPLIIDANFSTLWAGNSDWNTRSIVALLNSSWAKACMECTGTPLGGGALKLEATHLRRLPIPRLTDKEIEKLSDAGADLLRDQSHPSWLQDAIDAVVLGAVFRADEEGRDLTRIALELREVANSLATSRQRR